MNELIRLKLLSDIYSKMSDEEKRMLCNRGVLEALGRQERQIDDISNRIGSHPFASDLLANVAGNYITEGVNWLFRTLMKRL